MIELFTNASWADHANAAINTLLAITAILLIDCIRQEMRGPRL